MVTHTHTPHDQPWSFQTLYSTFFGGGLDKQKQLLWRAPWRKQPRYSPVEATQALDGQRTVMWCLCRVRVMGCWRMIHGLDPEMGQSRIILLNNGKDTHL